MSDGLTREEFEKALAILAAPPPDSGGNVADANQRINAIEKLKAIENRRPAEDEAIAELEATQGADTGISQGNNAMWRGFAHDFSLGQNDNIAGAFEHLKGGDFTKGRDDVRGKDFEANLNYGDQFRTGQMAGSGSLMGATIGLTGPKMIAKAPYALRGLYGAALGGGFTANQAIQQDQLEGNPQEDIQDYLTSISDNKETIALGAGLGAATQLVGPALNAGIRKFRNRIQAPIAGYGKKASGVVRDAVQDAPDGVAGIKQYFDDDMVPEAMLVDSPDLRRTGQGLATQNGAGGKLLERDLSRRLKSNSARIKATMDQYIGEPDEAYKLRVAEAKQRTHVLGPMYEASLKAGDDVPVDSVWSEVGKMTDNQVGPTKAALERLQADLGTAPVGPQRPINPVKAHNVRAALSDAKDTAYRAGAGNQRTALQSALNPLDDTLDANVPGYAEARTGYANSKAMDRAREFGESIFNGGRSTAISPMEFADEFAKLSPAQKDAVRAGVRGQLARIMGTSSNDSAAAWRELSKDWSVEKIRIVLGDDAAKPIINRLRGEKVFSQSSGDISSGSATGFRNAAAERLDPLAPAQGDRPSFIGRVKKAAIDDPLNAVTDSLLYGPRASQANLEVGQILGSTGPARDSILRQLLEEELRGGLSKGPSKTAQWLMQMLAGGSGAAATSNYITE